MAHKNKPFLYLKSCNKLYKMLNPHNKENLEPLWPWEHADIDPYRRYTGERP